MSYGKTMEDLLSERLTKTKSVVVDLLSDAWYLLQCAENRCKLLPTEYEQFEEKIKKLMKEYDR